MAINDICKFALYKTLLKMHQETRCVYVWGVCVEGVGGWGGGGVSG